MEITHLRYFKKTAELEHITKAAQELHVAQPSLSRTISMLEDELKVKLFNRKGKSIELNEYGIIVLNHTNRILKELEAIHREIDDARENSVMNVTFSMNAASTLIPRLVRGFKEEHSDIRLHILQEDLVEDSGQSCDLTLFAGRQREKTRTHTIFNLTSPVIVCSALIKTMHIFPVAEITGAVQICPVAAQMLWGIFIAPIFFQH